MEDSVIKSASVDILSYIVEFSPSMVREYMLTQANSSEDVSSCVTCIHLQENSSHFLYLLISLT